jgi:hypothetical protein
MSGPVFKKLIETILKYITNIVEIDLNGDGNIVPILNQEKGQFLLSIL